MKIVILCLFLSQTYLFALHSNAKRLQKNHYSSIGNYKKPGALVDIEYTTTQLIEQKEVSEVNLTLTSQSNKGKMKILVSLDENLEEINPSKKEHVVLLNAKTRTYPLNFSVSTLKEGVFYIRLQVSLNKRIRAFAIPIYSAGYQKKYRLDSSEKRKNISGKRGLSISKARERVR